MKRIKFIAIAAIVILAFVGGFFIYRTITGNKPMTTTKTVDDHTPVVLDSIKSIGKWSLLSIEMDQVVDTLDDGFLGTKIKREPVKVQFHGTLHYGYDTNKLPKNWVVVRGDSITFNLPDPQLLDDNFLDERKTIVLDGDQDFINKPNVRAALVRKAKAKMRVNGDKQKKEVKEKARTEVTRLLK